MSLRSRPGGRSALRATCVQPGVTRSQSRATRSCASDDVVASRPAHDAIPAAVPRPDGVPAAAARRPVTACADIDLVPAGTSRDRSVAGPAASTSLPPPPRSTSAAAVRHPRGRPSRADKPVTPRPARHHVHPGARALGHGRLPAHMARATPCHRQLDQELANILSCGHQERLRTWQWSVLLGQPSEGLTHDDTRCARQRGPRCTLPVETAFPRSTELAVTPDAEGTDCVSV